MTREPKELKRFKSDTDAIAYVQVMAAANPGRIYRARRGNRILWTNDT